MALSPLVVEIARRVRERLVARFGDRILEMRVFGSMARGEATEFSDLDLFVMVDHKDMATSDAIVDVCYEVGDLEMGLGFPISPLILDREHFEELLRRERRIAQDIRAEGVPV